MTFSAALFLASVAVWAETVRHYRRPIDRNGFRYKRGLNLTIVVLLGCVSFPLVTGRAARWLVCHVWRWDIQPRLREARRRIGARRAQTGLTAGAVLHAAAQPLALPSGRAEPAAQLVAQTAPAAATAPAAVLVAQADGSTRWEMLA